MKYKRRGRGNDKSSISQQRISRNIDLKVAIILGPKRTAAVNYANVCGRKGYQVKDIRLESKVPGL